MQERQKEVLRRFCALATKVRNEKFGLQHASDCFCPDRWSMLNFEFSEGVIEFLEKAIKEKLKGV